MKATLIAIVVLLMGIVVASHFAPEAPPNPVTDSPEKVRAYWTKRDGKAPPEVASRSDLEMPESAREAIAQPTPKPPSVNGFTVGDWVGIIGRARVYKTYVVGRAGVVLIASNEHISSLGQITEFFHKEETDEYFVICNGNQEWFLLDDLYHIKAP